MNRHWNCSSFLQNRNFGSSLRRFEDYNFHVEGWGNFPHVARSGGHLPHCDTSTTTKTVCAAQPGKEKPSVLVHIQAFYQIAAKPPYLGQDGCNVTLWCWWPHGLCDMLWVFELSQQFAEKLSELARKVSFCWLWQVLTKQLNFPKSSFPNSRSYFPRGPPQMTPPRSCWRAGGFGSAEPAQASGTDPTRN